MDSVFLGGRSRARSVGGVEPGSVDEGHIYTERSKALSLDIFPNSATRPTDFPVFQLTYPSLDPQTAVAELTKHTFRCHTLVFVKLRVRSTAYNPPNILPAIPGGSLSWLRELHLFGVLTNWPWKKIGPLFVSSIRS